MGTVRFLPSVTRAQSWSSPLPLRNYGPKLEVLHELISQESRSPFEIIEDPLSIFVFEVGNSWIHIVLSVFQHPVDDTGWFAGGCRMSFRRSPPISHSSIVASQSRVALPGGLGGHPEGTGCPVDDLFRPGIFDSFACESLFPVFITLLFELFNHLLHLFITFLIECLFLRV